MKNGWTRRWRAVQERTKRRLRNSRVHRLIGDRMFLPHVWGLDERSLAVGLALGMFIAFTPTIPFQILLCTVGAVLLRVNLAVGIAAVMLTNPVTAVPVYLAANRLGRFLCEATGAGQVMASAFSFEGRAGWFMKESLYLWTGCLVFSFVTAVLSYAGVRLAWRLSRRHASAAPPAGDGGPAEK